MKTRVVKPKGLLEIQEYERGVMLRFGKSKGVLEPGLHKAFPVIDEVRIVDMRPVEYETSLGILSQDKYPLSTTINLRYRVSDAELAVIKAPEGLEGQIDFLLKAEAGNKVCKSMTMNHVLANRDELGEDIKRFLNEHTGEWGIVIETTQVKELLPPSEVPDLQRELYELTMRNIIEPLRAEIAKRIKIISAEAEAEATTIGAQAEAKAYTMKAGAKLDAMERYFEIVGDASIKIAEKYGTKEARDVMFVLLGNMIGYDNPIGQKIKTKLLAEGIAEGAESAAREIQADPKFTYLTTAIQNIRGGILGITSFKDLGDLDRQLSKKIYNK